MTTSTTQPTVYLMIDGAAIARDERGEILETDEFVEGQPDWSEATVCDHRGIGGADGYAALEAALVAAEANALLIGSDPIRRVPREEATS